MEKPTARDIFDALDRHAEAIASGAVQPYDGACEMHAATTDGLDVMDGSLYFLFAFLTDRYELRPDERARVETEIRALADDWLQSGRDDLQGFLSRWRRWWITPRPASWER